MIVNIQSFVFKLLTKDIHLDYTIIRVIPVFLLAILLFWQKRKLNLLVMAHIVIVLALYARGCLLYPDDWSNNPLHDNTWIFNAIFSTTQNFVFCLIFIWLYQWWYTGRRRSEINGEW